MTRRHRSPPVRYNDADAERQKKALKAAPVYRFFCVGDSVMKDLGGVIAASHECVNVAKRGATIEDVKKIALAETCPNGSVVLVNGGLNDGRVTDDVLADHVFDTLLKPIAEHVVAECVVYLVPHKKNDRNTGEMEHRLRARCSESLRVPFAIVDPRRFLKPHDFCDELHLNEKGLGRAARSIVRSVAEAIGHGTDVRDAGTMTDATEYDEAIKDLTKTEMRALLTLLRRRTA